MARDGGWLDAGGRLAQAPSANTRTAQRTRPQRRGDASRSVHPAAAADIYFNQTGALNASTRKSISTRTFAVTCLRVGYTA